MMQTNDKTATLTVNAAKIIIIISSRESNSPLHVWPQPQDTFQCTALSRGTSCDTAEVTLVNCPPSPYPQTKMVKLYRPNQR